MSKLNDKEKQAIVSQKPAQKVTEPSKTTKKSVIKKTNPAVKTTPKKGNVKLVASKPVVAKPSPANIQKKPTKTKKSVSKPMEHIADQIKVLPNKRVWPD